MDQGDEKPGARHTYRMAQRDTTAVDIHLIQGNLELAVASDDLGQQRPR